MGSKDGALCDEREWGDELDVGIIDRVGEEPRDPELADGD